MSARIKLNELKTQLKKEFEDEQFYNSRNPNYKPITDKINIIKLFEELELTQEEKEIVKSSLDKFKSELDQFSLKKIFSIFRKLGIDYNITDY